MAKVDELVVKRITKLVYMISTIHGGRFIQHQYIGYKEEQAKSAFKKALEKGEL